MGQPVKRQYRSEQRAATATATRARLREAATRLFTEHGYTATKMKEIAALAGVGERTLYDAFPTKAALFGHTLAVATTGDEAPIRVADRTEIRAAQAEPDPRAAIVQYIGYATELFERAGDLIMVSVEAAGADPDMRAAADAGARATHEVYLSLTTRLDQRGALRPGLSPAEAADILYALASPHMHQLLRRHREWTVPVYREWLEQAACRELLDGDTGHTVELPRSR